MSSLGTSAAIALKSNNSQSLTACPARSPRVAQAYAHFAEVVIRQAFEDADHPYDERLKEDARWWLTTPNEWLRLICDATGKDVYSMKSVVGMALSKYGSSVDLS